MRPGASAPPCASATSARGRRTNRTRSTAQGWTLLDLLLRYRWRNVEASLALTNLTDTVWREAQFAETTCVNQRNGTRLHDAGRAPANRARCRAAVPRRTRFADGIDGISFTPGNPFGVRGGLQIFF